MKKTVIIGGGMAGLSAAVHLLRKGIKPLLLESTKKAGGRASSFFDSEFNAHLDNGQHILMGCYKETLALYTPRQIKENFLLQPSLHIAYSDGNRYDLSAKGYFYPLNLAAAILKYKPLSFSDAVSAGFFMKRVFFNLVKHPEGKNVLSWLRENGQNDKVITYLWAPLIIGAMNTSAEKADAVLFRRIIKEIFFKGNFASTVIVPKYDFQKSLVAPLLDTITSMGGEIMYSAQAFKVGKGEEGFTVFLRDGSKIPAQSVIFAVPRHALNKFELPDELSVNSHEDLLYSNILSVHLKVKEFTLKENFIGFHNSPVHWVFNKGEYLSVVISDADSYKEMSDNEILQIILPELRRNGIIKGNEITSHRIIKEKRATFVPDIHSQKYRLTNITKLPGLYLVGDWTDTGLPATIEGAALSGRKAADAVEEYFS